MKINTQKLQQHTGNQRIYYEQEEKTSKEKTSEETEKTSSVEVSMMENKTKLTHLNVILNVMCQVVGANYSDVNMEEDDWYFTHTWTRETEREFKSWLTDYLHKMTSAQREMCSTSHMKKDDCERAADMFLLNYGWCNKQPEWWLKRQNK